MSIGGTCQFTSSDMTIPVYTLKETVAEHFVWNSK
jgi:hypothetical protein